MIDTHDVLPEWKIKRGQRRCQNVERMLQQAAEAENARRQAGTSIKSFDDYVQLRRLPARTHVPSTIIPFWKALLMNVMMAVVNAQSGQSRDEAMLALLELPTIWLPKRASEQCLAHRISSGKPFHTNELRSTRTANGEPNARTRLGQAITRKNLFKIFKKLLNIFRAKKCLKETKI